MLVKPSITSLLGVVNNRFDLVIAAAKRARQVANGNPTFTDEKGDSAITIAAQEIVEGKVKIIC